MDEHIHEDFNKYCIDSLQTLNKLTFPVISMHNDFESILVYFDNSSHIEFLLKNTIMRLGNRWSHTVVCGHSNYNFIYSICNKISENIKIINVNSIYEISKNVESLFHGEKLLFYDENSLITNDNIYDFLHWDYIGSKIMYDKYDKYPFGGFALLTKLFASDFNNNIGDPKWKIADIASFNTFLSVTTKNSYCFGYHNYWFYNKSWKQEIEPVKYSQDGYYNPTHYKLLNIDLQSFNKVELLNHFRNFGFYEKKNCYIKNKEMHKYIAEYCDFDIEFNSNHYKHYNPELSQLTNMELLKHYNIIGKHQNKTAYDKTLELDYIVDTPNPLVGNCIILMNNSHDVNDETLFLYDYAVYLQDNRIYDNVIILDVILNEDLYDYYSKLKIKPLFHCNNFVLIREILKYYNPKLIYANSLNYLTLNINKFSQNIIRKTIFHFHDSIELIPPSIKNLKENVIYCTHEKISEHLYNMYGLTNTQIFRPFIIKESIDKYTSIDLFGNNNIIFGMFGKNNYEHGYDIFINLAKNMPQYNFLWIGGEYDSNFSADNFIQICNSVNAYKYINYIDYLLVTCRNKTPRIIYKALYNNCPCIVLENKMTQPIMTEGYYKIKNHNTDFNNIIYFLKDDMQLFKKQYQKINSHQFISDNYTKPYIYNYKINLSVIKRPNVVHEENVNGIFNWRHYLILNPDLTEHNILTYESALEHWNKYGKKENRYTIIRHCDIEENLNQYNNLNKRIPENWHDYFMDNLIKMKIRGGDPIVFQKFLYDNLIYNKLREKKNITNIVNKITSAISKWIFNDNYSELNSLPKKNGIIDLSNFGIDINNFDSEYFYKSYKKCWFNFNSIDDAIISWNVFGKNNNYLRSTEHELYEDLCFNWEYYVNANRLTFTNKVDAFLHWNKYGKRGGLIASNSSIRKTYEEFLNNCYDTTISFNNKSLIKPTANSFIDSSTLLFNKEFNKPLFNMLNIVEDFGVLKEAFLIIDFPNYGGGCEHFINCIISKYKSVRDFLIVRRFNNVLHFYLNDESKIEKTFNHDEAIEFIKTKQIKTIFVNSIVGHSDIFINTLFTLEIPIDTITHDYSLLYKFPQGYYHEIMSQAPNSYFPLHKCRTIITQNDKNLAIYGSSVNVNKFVISKLPDHMNPSKKITTNNKQIVIGIMGNISNLKGYYLIEKLVKYAKTLNNIRIVLFGNIPYFDNTFIEKYPYKNVDELNTLMSLHKPNLWFETSLWPETYSYTLTLMMITGLPILYQQKYYPSVVTDRLRSYDKSYPFDNIDTLLNNISDLTSKKQNFFHTINTKIYFNEFWDAYFGDIELQSKNIVFISSKVIVSTNKFDYSDSRSIYTTEERYDQTIKTIESIRKYIPNSYIILFDNSDFQESQYNELESKSDLFLNVCNDIDIYEYTNNKIYKLYGELAQTAYVLKYINENLGHLKIDNFFKISGRYWINETFNYNDYINDHNIFKRKRDVTDRKYYYTSFYKIAKKKFSEFTNLIINMFEESKTNDSFDGYDWEVLLSKKMKYDFIDLSNLGITENIAVWRQQTEI